MKILFTHFFSDKNKGDAAIMYAMIESFKNADADLDFKIVTTQSKSPADHHKVYSFFYLVYYKYHNAFLKLLNAAYVLGTASLWAFLKGRFDIAANWLLTNELQQTMEAYVWCDAAVPVGGGYITGKNNAKGTGTVLFQLHAIWIALLLHKPVYLYSQSIGPFGNNLQRKLSRFILSRCTHIFAREDYTIQTLKDIGVPDSIVSRSVDAAFGFTSDTKEQMRDYLQRLGVDFEKTVVGFTVKHFLSADKQKQYEQYIATFVQYLLNQGNYSIVFIPQVTSAEHHDDDRAVEKRIYDLLGAASKNVVLMDRDMNCYDVKGIYSNLDFLIGTRMHSCIFSLTARVPLIALQYEYKTGGIMKDIGLYEWVVLMQDVTDKILRDRFSLLQEKRDIYKEHLEKVLPPYIERHSVPAERIIRELSVV